jgi:hypothetical protein
MYISPHGKAAGLSDRLSKFAEMLASDKRYPWLGLGIIDDLRAAAAVIDGRAVPPTMLEEMEAEEKSKKLEYDL